METATETRQLEWYVLKVQKGRDTTVKRRIEERLEKNGLTGIVEEIIVPVENYFVIQNGKRVEKEKRILAGYVLVHADLKHNSEDFTKKKQVMEVIENVPGSLGFLEMAKEFPKPTRESEINELLGVVETKKVTDEWTVSEIVKINSGPFKTFEGEIKSIDNVKEKMTVEVSIFGRVTPVEVDWISVDKIR